jgi:hypothetical protein
MLTFILTLVLKIVEYLMMASKDYRLTNEIVNLYKLIIWQVFTLLHGNDPKISIISRSDRSVLIYIN